MFSKLNTMEKSCKSNRHINTFMLKYFIAIIVSIGCAFLTAGVHTNFDIFSDPHIWNLIAGTAGCYFGISICIIELFRTCCEMIESMGDDKNG